jgi:hypothetical protein
MAELVVGGELSIDVGSFFNQISLGGLLKPRCLCLFGVSEGVVFVPMHQHGLQTSKPLAED